MKLLPTAKFLNNVILHCRSECKYCCASTLSLVPGLNVATAQAEQKLSVYLHFVKAFIASLLERKTADDGDVKAGLEALNSIEERASSMNRTKLQ
ncbi:hypothetical protein ACOBV9_21425 (plasmid) [Pseudoalteromonas espejiana]